MLRQLIQKLVSRKKLLYGLAAAVAGYLLLAGLALPAWLKSSAEQFVAEKTGHKLTLAEVHFNPFTLALRVDGLRLDQPGGEPLLVFRELLVDLAASSLPRRTLVFDAIRLDDPQATVTVLADGHLNWSAFLDALKSKEESPGNGLPRLDIDRFTLAGGRVEFADRGRTPAFETRVEPIDFDLSDLSTLPDEQGQYRFTARTAFGAGIDWRGKLTLNPIAASGRLAVSDVALARLTPYLRAALKIAPAEGTAGLSTDYRLAYAQGKLDLGLDQIAFDLRGLALRGENETAPALALDKLEVRQGQFDLASRRLALGAVTLNAGRVDLTRRSDGRFNVEDWLVAAAEPTAPTAAPAAKSASGAGKPWQLQLAKFALADFAIRVGDRGAGTPRTLELERLAIAFRAAGEVGGGKTALKLDGLAASLADARLSAGKQPLFTLGRLAIEAGELDLAARQLAVGRVELAGGKLLAVRSADGRVPWLDALRGAPAGAAKPAGKTQRAAPAAAAEPAWRYRIDEIRLADFAAGLRDETVKPAAELNLQQIAVRLQGLNENLKAALPLAASLQVAGGGRLEASGKLVAGEPAVDLTLALSDLALKPARPYLSAVASLDLADGRVSSQGRATYDSKGFAYRGGFAVRDLRLNEAGTQNILLAWKSLATRSLNLDAKRLDISELRLDGLDTQLVINQDKSVNVQKVFKQPGAPATPAAPAAPGAPTPAAGAVPTPTPPPPAVATATAAASKAPPPFLVNVDRLRVSNGEMDFADHSLALPFGTRIHHLNGAINGLSSRPGAPGQVELDGQVDDFGLARAVGQVNFFQPTEFMDLKVVFRNVEMARLTPYTATFAGRKIESGKLSLDLEYKIKKRQLLGENQVIMDRLILGERVESPTAKNLPLDLAIAILQDSDGRIDLGLPVSGSLDDPQFSYGQIVWKAIVNVLTKIATAPFRALGALFGGGEKFEKIAFEAGAPQLTPPEREKLVRLAAALNKRPALALTIHGVYAETDRVALQDRQLRRTVADKIGLRDKADGATDDDPGPLSTSQPKVQGALESLFGDRFGGGELAALKDGFRQANPGQLEESTAGKMMSRLSGLFREKRSLNEQEVAQLKGADFHGVLYERLRQKEAIADERLQALAKTRGEATAAALKAAGAPAERVTLGAPEKIENDARDVPVKLELGTAKAGAPAAAAATAAEPAR